MTLSLTKGNDMWTARFVALVLLLASGSGDPIYKGPIRLGAFDVVKPVPVKGLLRHLGDPVSRKSPFCYRYAEAAYLRISVIPEQSESTGELVISSIPTCPLKATADAGFDFQSWKTPEGIGLGSTKGDVLSAYGPPTSIKKPDSELDKRFFTEYAPRMGGAGAIATEVVLYNGVLKGLPNSWTSARFGIQKDKVVWVMLTIDD